VAVTAHTVLSGVIDECSHYISSAPLTGRHKTKPFRRHDPKNHNSRSVDEMAGMDSLRIFEWGIPTKTGKPMCGAAKEIVEYTIPLMVSYPNTDDWPTFAFADYQIIRNACDPLTNPYTTTGCMFRQLDETCTITEQKERGAFLVTTKLQLIAEIDT
jgi:hypothetical protein